jgi:hypothetical protein
MLSLSHEINHQAVLFDWRKTHSRALFTQQRINASFTWNIPSSCLVRLKEDAQSCTLFPPEYRHVRPDNILI